MKIYMKKFLKIIAILLSLFGFCCFVGGALITGGIVHYQGELPLGHVNSIAVDNRGLIYVGLGFYGQIQVYNYSGDFIRHWEVDALGGMFEMDATENNNILVRSYRGHKLLLYNQYGEIISIDTIKTLASNFERSVTTYTTGEGITYKVEGWLFPKIVRFSPLRQTVIKQNIYFQIMQGPFPAWFWLALGTALRFALDREDKEDRN